MEREFVLNILGYQEEGEWVALALEMDLRGYGATFAEAREELLELIEMQVSFALQRENPSLIWQPAEPKYFAMLVQAAGVEGESFSLMPGFMSAVKGDRWSDHSNTGR